MVELPWRRASVRGIEVDIPRALTKRSHVSLSLGERVGVRASVLRYGIVPAKHLLASNSPEPLGSAEVRSGTVSQRRARSSSFDLCSGLPGRITQGCLEFKDVGRIRYARKGNVHGIEILRNSANPQRRRRGRATL